jgi:hypothetical protein
MLLGLAYFSLGALHFLCFFPLLSFVLAFFAPLGQQRCTKSLFEQVLFVLMQLIKCLQVTLRIRGTYVARRLRRTGGVFLGPSRHPGQQERA